MSLLNNPKKKAQGIVKKIEKGNATEANIINLGEILDKEPSIVSEITEPLISILKEYNARSFKLAISALNIVADEEIETISNSIDLFAGSLKKDRHPGEILKILEIILKIYQEYPEKMSIVVPGLFLCLRNMNETVRKNAYFLMASIAIHNPEFFKGYSKELILALNGLNLDERINACKIIKKIAEKDPIIVENTYNDLSYLLINHHSRELRIEAEAAIDKLKIKEKVEPPEVIHNVTKDTDIQTSPDSGGPFSGKSGGQELIPEFAGTIEKENRTEILNVQSLENIIKKDNSNISGQVEQIISGTDIRSPILESVLNIAMEISREGREGKPIGTAFILGNSTDVLAKSKQLIFNPVEGVPPEEKMISDPDFRNSIKELAQLDGVFVISGAGVVEAACRFLIADASLVNIPKGFGTKHFSVAAMTMATRGIGIVVSESGGKITIFKEGKIFCSFSKA